MIGILCGLLFTAVVVAAVGHALWLAAASIWRLLNGSPTASPAPPLGSRCEVCHHPRGVLGDHCRMCGAPANEGADLRHRGDLFATQRQINRWIASGKLDPPTHQALRRLLDAELAGQAVAKLATATPAAPSAVSKAPEVSNTSNTSPFAAEYSAMEIVDAEIVSAETVTAATVPVHPLDRVSVGTPIPPRPSAPHRAFADVLQAFMEQKNIRWVELISGLLVVGGATGLVVSLRAALKDKIPYFPAISFFLITAAFHAAGIYSLRRWNLKSTSRGVLIIATLLVPLSILAAIFLSGEGEQQRAVTDPVFLLAAGVGVLGFGAMNYYASRAILRHGWWRLMVAVLGPSFGQLIINRGEVSPAGPIHAALLMLLPVSAYLVANAGSLALVRRRPHLGRRPTQQFFLELGIATFAISAPVGLFLARADSAAEGLRALSPLLSLCAAAMLASGLFAHRRLNQPELIAFKTAGTGLAILGAGLMVLMVCFAWPQLSLLIAVGILNFATLSLLAIIGDLALLHVLAVACLALAYLAGFLLWRGFPADGAETPQTQLVRAIVSGASAAALAAFATATAAAGIGLLRKFRETGRAYLLASAGVSGVCLAIATYTGYWSGPATGGDWATILFLYFAIAALIAAPLIQRSEAAWLGSALILVGAIHGLRLNSWLSEPLRSLESLLHHPVLAAFLVHALCAAGCAAGCAAAVKWTTANWTTGWRSVPNAWRLAPNSVADTLLDPLAWSGLASSILVIPFSLWVTDQRFGAHAAYLAGSAIVWLLVLFVQRLPWAWSGFQALSTLSLAYFTTSMAARQSWWSGDLYDARHVQLQIITLGISCIGWTAFRQLAAKRHERLDLPNRLAPTVDQLLVVLLSLAVVVTALVGCVPGLRNELAALGLSALDLETVAAQRFVTGGAWLGWAVILIALGCLLWERRSGLMLSLLVFASAAAPWFVAGRFFDVNSTASAARWGMAVFAVVWFVPAYFLGGRDLARTSWRSDIPRISRPTDLLRSMSLALSLIVVLGITTTILLRVAAREPVGVPLAESFFARIGSAWSYAVPLAILVGVLLGYAIREAKSGYAFAASLVFQYFISLACLLPALSAGATIDPPLWAKLLQWNCVGLGAFALVWISLRRWIETPVNPTREPTREPTVHSTGEFWPVRLADVSLLSIQMVLLLSAIGGVAVWIMAGICSDATRILPEILVLGGWVSYLAIGFAMAAGWWLLRHDPHELGHHLWHDGMVVLVPVLAATAQRNGVAAEAWGYHVLVVGWLIVAAIAVSWMCWRMRQFPLATSRRFSAPAIVGILWGTVALLLAGLAAWTNINAVPSQSPEMLAAWGAVVVLGTYAVRLRLPPFSYASIFCGGIAMVLVRADLPAGHPLKTPLGAYPQFSFVILSIGCAWLGWEVWFQRRGESGLGASGRGAAHRFVARAAMACALLFVGLVSLHLVLSGRPAELTPAEFVTFVLAFAALLALQLGSLWDRRGHYGTFGLYVWILAVGVFVVDLLPLSAEARPVAWIATIATQVAVTGWAWSWGGKLAALGGRLGMVDPIESLRRAARWLTAANLILSAEVFLAATWVVLGMEARELRVSAACLPLLLAGGIAGIAQQHRRDSLQLTALLVATWGVVLLGWSDMVPAWSPAVILARAIRSLMALTTVGFILGVFAVRVIAVSSAWRQSARRVAVILAGTAIVVLLGILALEVQTFVPGVGAPVNPAQIAAVSIVLVALVATLISLAVLPGRDPLALTERGRMLYVYGAQLVAGLLFAHLYLAVPGMFQGHLRPYWPYVVLVIAFAGVGVGTLFDRLGWRVLAEPFQRSGSFLPLVPAIGMWIANSDSSYTAVLFVIGVLYMLLSFTQRSPLARAAAGIAGNGALWSLLSGQENLAFGEHPQFWLIPPAVSAMIAAQLNRERLGEARIATVRYVAMGVIYLSSSVEMLKIGIGELWPPVILICLALAGVVFGIAMQVRAYLYLGSVFVLISLVSMVAHASRSIHHVWPWWAFLIAMGILILVVFGYFEGRRAQIIALIERLRQWEK